jgi:RHS repeat-associated protein
MRCFSALESKRIDQLYYFSDSTLAVVLSSTDYYPFGMEMHGRTFSSNKYRYGYNGMEKDDEMEGSGNSYTTEFRMYDPRIGRWLSKDMLVKPWESPYAAFANNPIYYADPTGLNGENGRNPYDDFISCSFISCSPGCEPREMV